MSEEGRKHFPTDQGNKPVYDLTLRELYAGLIMAGYAASRPMANFSEMAEQAVCQADQLVAELDK